MDDYVERLVYILERNFYHFIFNLLISFLKVMKVLQTTETALEYIPCCMLSVLHFVAVFLQSSLYQAYFIYTDFPAKLKFILFSLRVKPNGFANVPTKCIGYSNCMSYFCKRKSSISFLFFRLSIILFSSFVKSQIPKFLI